MTDLAANLLVATLVIGAIDWWAVGTGRRAVELAFKPLTMLVLIGAALTLDPTVPAARNWLVAGLILSLAGDVFLMFGRRGFLIGLFAFLLGHVAYVVGLLQFELSPRMLIPGLLLMLLNAKLIGPTLVRGAARTDRKLPIPVVLYIVVISAMVIVAFGTARPLAIVGALLFYASDCLLGWYRFVRPVHHGRLINMIAYHLGQLGLVLGLGL